VPTPESPCCAIQKVAILLPQLDSYVSQPLPAFSPILGADVDAQYQTVTVLSDTSMRPGLRTRGRDLPCLGLPSACLVQATILNWSRSGESNPSYLAYKASASTTVASPACATHGWPLGRAVMPQDGRYAVTTTISLRQGRGADQAPIPTVASAWLGG
jgi:hypothetical protein